jgi:hypothetical protein
VVVNAPPAFGFLIADDGTYSAFDSGTSLFEDDDFPNNRGDTGDAIGPYAIEITVLTTDFSVGANATASITVDGTAIDLDDDTAGVQPTHVFTWDTGDNYFNFESFTEDSTDFDDIQIAIIPEPASFALLLLGGLAVIARRRRRA